MSDTNRLFSPFLVLHTWRAGWGGWTTIDVLRDLGGGNLSVDRAQIDTSQSSWLRDSSITLVLVILDHLFQILQDLKVGLAQRKHGLWVIVLLLLLLRVHESVKAKLEVCLEWRRGLLLLLLVASGRRGH